MKKYYFLLTLAILIACIFLFNYQSKNSKNNTRSKQTDNSVQESIRLEKTNNVNHRKETSGKNREVYTANKAVQQPDLSTSVDSEKALKVYGSIRHVDTQHRTGASVVCKVIAEDAVNKINTTLAAVHLQPDADGNFSAEIKYRTAKNSSDSLVIGVSSPFDTSRHVYKDGKYSIDYSSLCYVNNVTFNLKDAGDIVNVELMCAPVAALEIRVVTDGIVQAEEYSFMFEIKGAEKYFLTSNSGDVPLGYVSCNITTDGNKIEFNIPAGEELEINCSHPDFVGKKEIISPLQAGEKRVVQIVMEKPQHKFIGRCVDIHGNGIKDVYVSAFQEGLPWTKSVTDVNGNFELSVLNKQLTSIYFSKVPYKSDPNMRDINIYNPLTVTLERDEDFHEVPVKCMDEQGNPVSGAWATDCDENGIMTGGLSSKPIAAFEAGSQPGSYRLYLSKEFPQHVAFSAEGYRISVIKITGSAPITVGFTRSK
ncbi:MAG: hypothetical protein HY606_04005 [Planctomycetes bacterium]|nr:hypothetical protein [Planctomycetota bacterium]